MDPKKELEAFRVEEVRQKKLIPKQKYNQGNAILIIMFAIMLGLTTGVGSAFAFGMKEVQPSRFPLDEPSAKPKLEVRVPEIKVNTTELSPLKPPIDQPTVEEKAPIVIETQRVKEQPEREHSKENNTRSNQEVQPVKEKPTVSTDEPITEPTTEPIDKGSTPELISKGSTPELISKRSNPKPIDKGSTPVHQASETPTQPVDKTKKQTESTKKKVNSAPIHYSSTPDKQEPKSPNNTNSTQVTRHETPDPKTKQGTLPDTAGNYLNHALVGFIIVCCGTAYFLVRRENHPA
jgi:hypothetical protein